MMRRNLRLIGVIAVVALLAFFSTGCMSMLVGLSKGMNKDYGVYDETVPVDQLCELHFELVNITSFNGNSVQWGDGEENNFRHIKISVGTNDFVFDYMEKHLTDIDSRDTATHTITTYNYTTSSLDDIPLTGVTMLPGHRYRLNGILINGEAVITMLDVTNTPSLQYGGVVADAPKASKTPTEIEGTWETEDGTVFTFAGNTFEMTWFPGGFMSTPGTPEEGLIMQGTFAIDGGKITMHALKRGIIGDILLNIAAFKESYIYTYSFAEGNLVLEVECLYPKMTYLKQ